MIYSKIKMIRIKTGLSQIEAAKKLEISPSYLCAIENQHRPLVLAIASRMSKLYRVPIEEITNKITWRKVI